MTDVIRMHETSKWFGEVVAVNNLSVAIGPGVTGLLGPNGAGKSTFIKLALGLYVPSRGSVDVFGATPRNNLDALRRIGYCPETDAFPEGMTGRDFVYWNMRFHGMAHGAAQSAAREALARLRMEHRMDDRIAGYSKGMRQRVKIAQAIAHRPDLVFLDEPMSGLDPEGREELFAFIRDYARDGRTVLVSSHILHEIERITTHVVMLRNGSLLAHGDVHEIRDHIAERPIETPCAAEHAHAITVSCPDPRGLAAAFLHHDAIVQMDFARDAVTFRTRDPHRLYEEINARVIDENIAITAIVCPDDNLQAVFAYLTE
ncbi:MAG TPA: ABC transporter ATP-binding protein [Candidatus Hydrogenedentes bacterium]|nr:ABC transporter ATP-binding protein [Candidatus Hydrogenedentota bacterium]